MKKVLLFTLLSVFMCLVSTSSAVAQNVDQQDKEYREVLGKMMDVSGGLAGARSAVPQMIEMFKKQSPSIDQAYWDAFNKKWSVKFVDRMVDLFVPIYKKYFTLDDLKQIIVFYETPVGKKLGEFTPAMMGEGMQLGQQLGIELSNEIQQELQQHNE